MPGNLVLDYSIHSTHEDTHTGGNSGSQISYSAKCLQWIYNPRQLKNITNVSANISFGSFGILSITCIIKKHINYIHKINMHFLSENWCSISSLCFDKFGIFQKFCNICDKAIIVNIIICCRAKQILPTDQILIF